MSPAHIRLAMKCPICKDKLVEVGPGARRCRNRHGFVVSAKVLKEGGAHVMRADATDAAGIAYDAWPERVIHCPACLSQMMAVDYGGLGIMIDVCFSCPYRWLDAGELTKIAGRVRRTGRLRPEQLMALEGLNSAMEQEVSDSGAGAPA
jgi:Zn-finger nucleic acid-binding protein